MHCLVLLSSAATDNSRLNMRSLNSETTNIFNTHQGHMTESIMTHCTPCPKKTKQICFCQNFVKFPPISIIFGRKIGNDANICEVHSFSTSPNLRHHLTVLNANVPNCYITPKLLVIDRSHWRPGELHIFHR